MILLNSASIRFLFLLMCVICTKSKEVVPNPCYTNICFTLNYSLKMLSGHCQYFHYFNFKMTLTKILWAKQPFFNFFQILRISQNFTFWQPLEVKWLPSELNELNCFSLVWLTCKRRLALFSTRNIVRDPHHRESPTHYEEDLNLRKTWV